MPPPAAQSLTHHRHSHHAQHHAAPSQSDPVQLAHFVIFNPTLIPPKQRKRNKVDDPSTESTRSSDHAQTALAPPSSRSQSDSEHPSHVTSKHASEPAPAGTTTTGGSRDGKSSEILEAGKNPNPDDADVATKTPNNDASSQSPNKEDDNPDLEDDLREAAQIVFYTSHQAGGVSRDTMLRQVGLAKGLMGFSDMAAPSCGEKNVWAVHGSHSRMIVYAPLPNWYMYICIKSAESGVHALSDQMLVSGLERGYQDFCLTHGAFDTHEPGHDFVSQLERFFTRFTLAFEATYLSPPSLLTWLGGQAPSDPALQVKLQALPPPPGSTVGLITRSSDGAVLRASAGPQLDPPITDALMRYLTPLVPLSPAPEKEKKTERQALGFGFRRKEAKDLRQEAWTPLSWVGLAPRSASATPPPKPPPAHKVTASGGGRRWFNDIGGVFGLGSKPASPAPDVKESKDKQEASTLPESLDLNNAKKLAEVDESNAGDDPTDDEDKGDSASTKSKSDEADVTPTPSATLPIPSSKEPGPQVPILAVSAGDSIVTSVASDPSTASTPSVSTLGHAHAAPSVATDMTDATATIEPSLNTSEGTTLVDDGASVRTTRSTPSLIAPEGRPPSIAIQDALASEPDPWVQRAIYVPQKARLRFVVRNGAMVFIVEPETEADAAPTKDGETLPTTADSDKEGDEKDTEMQSRSSDDADVKEMPFIDPSTLKDVFTALDTAPSATITPSPMSSPSTEKLPLGIYHTPGVTKVRPVPNLELVALANLREIGTLNSFGQLPSGRFVARKEEEDGAELFVQTHRNVGITEAERALRQWSYDCESI